MSGREILERMREGDETAVAAFLRLRNRVARGLAMVVNILDPDIVVLGGGVSNIDELYGEELDRLIAKYTFGGRTHTKVVKNRHGDSSGVRGAAWLWPAREIPGLTQ